MVFLVLYCIVSQQTSIVTPKTFVCVLDFANVFFGDWVLFYVQFLFFTLSISLRCLYHHPHMVIETALTL